MSVIKASTATFAQGSKKEKDRAVREVEKLLATNTVGKEIAVVLRLETEKEKLVHLDKTDWVFIKTGKEGVSIWKHKIKVCRLVVDNNYLYNFTLSKEKW